MKKLILLATVTLFFAACQTPAEKTETTTETNQASLLYFGDSIAPDGAVNVAELKSNMQGDSVKIKVTGVISEVCQKKGCWMTVKLDSTEEMMVKFKDYGFFMPLDAAGKKVTFEGYAFTDTTSVDDLKHYAEDAGKSQEEIDAITEPEVALEFEASGVIIEDEKK